MLSLLLLALGTGWRYIEGYRKSQQGLAGNFRSQTFTYADRGWRYIGGRYIVGRLYILRSLGFFLRNKYFKISKSSNMKTVNT